ncbi:CPBP family glutamic-type intramembrane protease [Paracoccus sp. (in: a-proteobacteria)]|uniref:CPBP family glutamic-type intramembrane protease n=1 Tax=Paracoccus sp. TaxID=267 RepID=UPI0032208070
MAGPPAAIARARLRAEFAALYLGAPLAMALFLPHGMLFAALALFSAAGLALLWFSGGFDWRGLLRGWGVLPWPEMAAVTAATLGLGAAILAISHPGAIFNLARDRPGFMALVWVLYPVLSALPQELIFRPLFFHRYGAVLPAGRAAIWLNAGVFAFAHLMYWSWVVAGLSFLGGLVFARAYLTRGFPAAWVLHALAGNALFTVGMGAYFYSGNVVRPF